MQLFVTPCNLQPSFPTNSGQKWGRGAVGKGDREDTLPKFLFVNIKMIY